MTFVLEVYAPKAKTTVTSLSFYHGPRESTIKWCMSWKW